MNDGSEAVRAQRSSALPGLIRIAPYGVAFAGAATAAGFYLLAYFRSDPLALLGSFVLLSTPVWCVLLPLEMAQYRRLEVPERDHLLQRHWRLLTTTEAVVSLAGMGAIALPILDLRRPYGPGVLVVQVVVAGAAFWISSRLGQHLGSDPRRIYRCRPRLGYCRDCDTRAPIDVFDTVVRSLDALATTTLLTDPVSGKSYMVEMVSGRRMLEETTPTPSGRLTRTFTLADPPRGARILRVVGYTDFDPQQPDIDVPLLGLVLGDPVAVEALALDGAEIRALTARLQRAAYAALS